MPVVRVGDGCIALMLYLTLLRFPVVLVLRYISLFGFIIMFVHSRFEVIHTRCL